MFIANKRTVDQALKNPDFDFVSSENLFAFAMLQLSNSIRFEDVQHIQPSLTNCVVQDAREIPCVTFEHSFLFILTFEKAKLILQPVPQGQGAPRPSGGGRANQRKCLSCVGFTDHDSGICRRCRDAAGRGGQPKSVAPVARKGAVGVDGK